MAGAAATAMASLWLDLRYALRMMARAPGLTTILLLTLALGIGSTTTIFSVVHSIILRPLPYEHPEQLVRVRTLISGKLELPHLGITTQGYYGMQQASRSVRSVAAWRARSSSLAGGDRPIRAELAAATYTLAPLLGVRPLLGRWFDEKEDRPGKPEVIVLGHDLWLRTFGGDPAIVGKQLRLDGAPVTVIGVMPPSFRFPDRETAWVPLCRARGVPDEASFNLEVIARLAPGASLAAFREELAVQAEQWTRELTPVLATGGLPPMQVRAVATGFLDDLLGSLSTTLWLLQGAVLFVLLISIVNVANLLLARAETRTREVAVRHALGASRRRLLRQFLTESVVLGLGGGALGILVTMWAVDGVSLLLPREAPRADEILLDGRAIGFAVACSVAAALVFGLAPILHARRIDLHGALKDGSSRMTGSKAQLRTRRALVVSEIALAVTLVVGCTVMVRSFLRLQKVELGFAPDHLLTFGVALPEAAYPADAADQFWRRLGDRLRALPGVRAASLVEELPPVHPKDINAIKFPGRSAGDHDEPDWVLDFIQIADEHMLSALSSRLVRGRMFTSADDDKAPYVMLVNEAFARKFFRGRDPIGQKIQPGAGKQPEMTVIGVIADMKQGGLDQPSGAQVILPLWQYASLWEPRSPELDLFAVVRTAGAPADLIPAVQRLVAELDPALPVFAVHTMDEVLWEAVARPRFLLFLLSSFAVIALVLAAVGIYGVMAHTVAQRTHEIGLRVALGATPGKVRAMVLRQAATLVAAGVTFGLVASIVLSETLGATLRGMFYGEQLAQPTLLAAVALAVTAVALLATWIPARRATQVQPTVALRSE